ncbi:FAD-binding Berberine family protein [Striga asiatica]|uniref:FAD-binding Berberine family protein n=1 Tax=Striga asiatica TaxID=4170 RepID=A0A5A7PNE3_STRAF|nr:FAD-binding Berberine family protein [Striga asiatica]
MCLGEVQFIPTPITRVLLSATKAQSSIGSPLATLFPSLEVKENQAAYLGWSQMQSNRPPTQPKPEPFYGLKVKPTYTLNHPPDKRHSSQQMQQPRLDKHVSVSGEFLLPRKASVGKLKLIQLTPEDDVDILLQRAKIVTHRNKIAIKLNRKVIPFLEGEALSTPQRIIEVSPVPLELRRKSPVDDGGAAALPQKFGHQRGRRIFCERDWWVERRWHV